MSIKKYITGSYSELIKTVELERETEHTIWFKDKNGKGDSCRKQSSYSRVFDTFQEAKDYLLEVENNYLARYNNLVLNCVDKINRICALEETI